MNNNSYEEEILEEIKKQNNNFDFFKIIIVLLLIFIIIIELVKFTHKYQEQENKKTSFYSCTEKADERYTSIWEEQCKIHNKKENCSLPISIADQLEEQRNNEIDMCKFILVNNLF